MAARWLVKTEPSDYSFDQLVRDGRTEWTGVRNAVAQRHLARMRAGDHVLVYHTGNEKAVVGTAVVEGEPHPDPTQHDPRILAVTLRAGAPLARPVPLAEIKATPALADWELVRLPRLSVMPVSAAQWAEVQRLARG